MHFAYGSASCTCVQSAVPVFPFVGAERSCVHGAECEAPAIRQNCARDGNGHIVLRVPRSRCTSTQHGGSACHGEGFFDLNLTPGQDWYACTIALRRAALSWTEPLTKAIHHAQATHGTMISKSWLGEMRRTCNEARTLTRGLGAAELRAALKPSNLQNLPKKARHPRDATDVHVPTCLVILFGTYYCQTTSDVGRMFTNVNCLGAASCSVPVILSIMYSCSGVNLASSTHVCIDAASLYINR